MTYGRSVIGTVTLLMLAGSAAWAADGAAVYKAECAKCHGDTGKSDTAVAQAMKLPPLAGSADLQKMSAADIAAKIAGVEKHPPKVKALGADATAVAEYVKQLAAE